MNNIRFIGIEFSTSGIFMLIGIALAYVLLQKISIKNKISTKMLNDNILISLAIGIFSAKLSHILFYFSEYYSWKFFITFNGGMTLPLVGMFAGSAYIIYKSKKFGGLNNAMYIFAPSILLVYLFHFLIQYIFGAEVGVITEVFAYIGIYRHPVYLYYILLGAVSAFFLYKIYNTKVARDVQISSLYLFFSAMFFFISFFVEGGLIWVITPSQIFALFALGVSFVAFKNANK